MGKAAQRDHPSLRDQETEAQGYKMKPQSWGVTLAGPEPRPLYLPVSSWGSESPLGGLTTGTPGVRWVLQVKK